MNRNLRSLTVVALICLLGFPSCLEYEVNTEVSRDGSVKRVVKVKSLERKSLPRTAFPVPTSDSSWTSELKEHQEGKQTEYEYIATKRFATPEKLEQEYANIPDTADMDVKVSLMKGFEWFYTYFDYQETYHLRYPFTSIPIAKVLTNDEINYYLYHKLETMEDSILDAKVQNWDRQNKNEDAFRSFMKVFEQRNDPELSVVHLMKNKERFLSLLDVKTGSAKNVKNPDPVLFVLKCLEEALKTKAVYRLRDEVASAIAEHDKKNHLLNRAAGTYKNIIQLPGLLLHASSDEIEGNSVSWSVRDNQLKVGEFVMKARSRVTNTWAFGATGIGGLVVLVFVVRNMVKGRPR